MSQIQTNVGFKETTEYKLTDSEGNIKPLFQPNKFYLWLLNHSKISPHLTFPFLGKFADSMIISNKSQN